MMKIQKIFFVTMLVLGFIACKNDKASEKILETPNKGDVTEKTEDPAVYMISEGNVGNFSIGETMPGATMKYSMETKTETRAVEGGQVTETYYILYANGKKHLVLKYGNDREGQTDKIGEIWVFSEKYQTEEGIGTGSTIKEFMEAYPDYKLWYTYVSDRYVIQDSESSVQFLLDKNGFIGKKDIKSEMTELEASDFKEDTRIEKIRIYKQ